MFSQANYVVEQAEGGGGGGNSLHPLIPSFFSVRLLHLQQPNSCFEEGHSRKRKGLREIVWERVASGIIAHTVTQKDERGREEAASVQGVGNWGLCCGENINHQTLL